jgi:hypothetical protein
MYLARFMPMVVAKGKFNVLASSKYIEGDTCNRKESKQTRSMTNKHFKNANCIPLP